MSALPPDFVSKFKAQLKQAPSKKAQEIIKDPERFKEHKQKITGIEQLSDEQKMVCFVALYQFILFGAAPEAPHGDSVGRGEAHQQGAETEDDSGRTNPQVAASRHTSRT